MENLNWKDAESCAKELVNNHSKFNCFFWHREGIDKSKWCIVYTHNRDSGLLEISNSKVIEKVMKKFINKDVYEEDHNHWVCGWIKGYSIKVYNKNNKVTKAFKAYCEIMAEYSNYPVLDENDYSEMEYNATIQNIMYEGKIVDEKIAKKVYYWISEHKNNSVESVDDQGGYPSSEDIEEALAELKEINI